MQSSSLASALTRSPPGSVFASMAGCQDIPASSQGHCRLPHSDQFQLLSLLPQPGAPQSSQMVLLGPNILLLPFLRHPSIVFTLPLSCCPTSLLLLTIKLVQTVFLCLVCSVSSDSVTRCLSPCYWHCPHLHPDALSQVPCPTAHSLPLYTLTPASGLYTLYCCLVQPSASRSDKCLGLNEL